MNVKIKDSGVYCLLGNKYEMAYTALKKAFGDGEEQIFAPRTPGAGYLQWELPGAAWVSLKDCDPVTRLSVLAVLEQRKDHVKTTLGDNQSMAQMCLTVPDEAYIYFKREDDKLLVRLTVWGYRYPERVKSGDAKISITKPDELEHVSIILTRNGAPVADYPVTLNGFGRTSDGNGAISIGQVPIGTSFTLEIDGQKHALVVEKGRGQFAFDMTEYARIQVLVNLDNAPYSNALIVISRGLSSVEYLCDGNGRYSIEVPLDFGDNPCTVTVSSQSQTRILNVGLNVFVFDLQSQKTEEKTPDVIANPDPVVEDNHVEEHVDDESVVDETINDNNSSDNNENTDQNLNSDGQTDINTNDVDDQQEDEEQSTDQAVPPVIPPSPQYEEASPLAVLLYSLAIVALVVGAWYLCDNILMH